jgi:hypothetical protein
MKSRTTITMSMLVSSAHPAKAGVQVARVETRQGRVPRAPSGFPRSGVVL